MTGTNVLNIQRSSDSLPANVKELTESERDALIVSSIQVNSHKVILSRYGDDIWLLNGFTSNSLNSKSRLNFNRLPPQFRTVMKAILYRYLYRGRAGQKRPRGITLFQFFGHAQFFLRHLNTLKITNFSAVTPMVCATYIAECRGHKQLHQNIGKLLSPGTLLKRFEAVEALHELSQYTNQPFPHHPWPETSPKALAGMTGKDASHRHGGRTPLIPDDVFCALFDRAYAQVQGGKALLDLRDALNSLTKEQKGQSQSSVMATKNRHLVAHGWKLGLAALNMAIIDLRTACYIVIASTSGCRNHELANLQSGAHHRTEDDAGTIFHWMRSKSEKTDAGVRDWMIPQAAVRALRLMERWAEPYQAMIAAEIAERRRINPRDPEIAKAQRHRHALFLGCIPRNNNQVRTLTGISWNGALKSFAQDCALNWRLTTHQFRRKFASYVAHSQFGDLRYLREHFGHWSMDMTLGYAIDQGYGQHLDIELYEDIQIEHEDIKRSVVNTWLQEESLSGGYGRSIKRWQRDPTNLAIFKSHASMVTSISDSTAIRSNGHAWCTAGDDRCVGNTLDRTRCSGCNNAVIANEQAGIYQRLYENLKRLLDCNDIGDSGRQRVSRDLNRCREVLMELGYDPETNVA